MRARDLEIDANLRAIEEELEARRPGATFEVRGSLVYDFTGELHLLGRWEAVLDRAAATAKAQLPPLLVNTGDFVAWRAGSSA